MDPFSSDGELVNIHTALTQAQYASVLHDFSPSSFSSTNTLPIQILQYRAQCALQQYDEVIGSISDADAESTPDLAAVRTYASFLRSGSESEDAVAEAERLAESQDQAIHLLSQHQGSLDAVALAIQIHLSQNRTDLAAQAARTARSFAQDALLVNLAESWIAMRQGGGENYQKAYYVFEELAQAPSSSSATMLVAQAVSEVHLGRLEEADVALAQALEREEGNACALANKVVLDTLLGRETGEDAWGRLRAGKGEGLLLLLEDFEAKREAFRAAAGKYNPRFEP